MEQNTTDMVEEICMYCIVLIKSGREVCLIENYRLAFLRVIPPGIFCIFILIKAEASSMNNYNGSVRAVPPILLPD